MAQSAVDKLLAMQDAEARQALINGLSPQARLKLLEEVQKRRKGENQFSDVKSGASSTAGVGRSSLGYGAQNEGMRGNPEATKKERAEIARQKRASGYANNPELAQAEAEATTGHSTGTLKTIGSIGAGIAAPMTLPATAGPLAATLAGALGMTAFDQITSGLGIGGNENHSLTGNILDLPPEQDAIAEVGENLVAGGAIGKIGRALYNRSKALSQPVINSSLLQLEPTVAQLTPESPIQAVLKPVANALEGLFAPEAKALAAQRSAGLAKERAEAFIERETGRKIKLDSIRNDTARQTLEMTEAYNQSLARSQQEWEKAITLAEGPQRNILQGEFQLKVGVDPATGADIFEKFPYAVKGGIPTVRSGMAAQDFFQDVMRGAIPIPQDHPMVRLAQTIMQESQGGAKPITFSQAMKNMQALEQIASAAGQDLEVAALPRFYKIFNALEKDLNANVKKFAVNAPGIEAAMKNAIGTTRQRLLLFTPGGNVTRNSRIVLNNLDKANAVIQDVDQQIRNTVLDPHQLKRAIARSRIDFNAPLANGKFQLTPITPATTMKKDLGAWLIGDILDKSMYVPDMNFAEGAKLFDAQKAAALARDPYVDAAMKELFNAEQRNGFKLFLKDLEAINYRRISGENKYLQVKIGSSIALSLAAGMASYMNGGSAARNMAFASGGALVGFSGAGLGKLFTNAKTARLIHNMMNGIDLGMPRMAAAQLIKEAVIGEKVTLTEPNGKSQEVIVTKDGFKPIEEN